MTERDYRLWLERYGGWVLIGIFCALPVLRFAQLGSFQTYLGTTSLTLKTLGRVTGLVGTVLYAINLLLAARTRWMENFFGGLNRVYIAHHLTGGIALVLLLFHPIFLAIRLVEISALSTLREAALYLLPRAVHFDASFREVLEASSINNGIIAFVGMVGLLILTFFVKLPYRVWLFTHKFLGVAFIFAGLHVIFVSSNVFNDKILLWYYIIWTVVGLTAYIYRSIMGNIFVRRAPYEVEFVGDLPGNVVGVAMKPREKKIDFQPGQFVFARFLWSANDGIIREAHPFSIASSPSETDLRLYMKKLGDFTTSLQKLKPGTIAEIEGAFGRFVPSRYPFADQVWVGGGIGITPFLSMARSLQEGTNRIDLFYSVVHRSELLDQQAIAEAIPTIHKSFHYHSFIGDEQQGFISASYLEKEAGGLAGKEIFICGPPPMMRSLRSQLRKMGIPNRRIHTEEFSMQ